MKTFYFILSILLFANISQAQLNTNNKELSSVKLKTLDGKEVDLKTYVKSGQITIVSFWATWCSPCKKELDNMSPLMADWKKKYNVALIAISIDNSQNAQKVKPLVNGKGWDFDVLLDVNADTKRSLNYNTIPFTLLIDQNKKIVYQHSGYVEGDEDHLEEEIKKISK
jgi:cytochrome c biogenesis protein CcmG, thiol:disulfide interchange protein DsbE